VLLDREKRVLAIGGVLAALLLLVAFVILPAVSRLRLVARQTAAAEKNLAEVRKAKPELERTRRETAQRTGVIAATANLKESPTARLTSILQEAGIPQSAISLKSGGARDGETFREESFDVRMENLTYLEAVKTLQRLSGPAVPLVVRSAQLKSRYDNPKYLDVTLRVGYLSQKP